MAVGDKIYLADKETLDIVKQKVDNIQYKILKSPLNELFKGEKDTTRITLADKQTLDEVNIQLDSIQEFAFDGTALENEVVKGKTFYTNGIDKHTGTFNIDNLKPENIKEGIYIGDVLGNLKDISINTINDCTNYEYVIVDSEHPQKTINVSNPKGLFCSGGEDGGIVIFFNDFEKICAFGFNDTKSRTQKLIEGGVKTGGTLSVNRTGDNINVQIDIDAMLGNVSGHIYFSMNRSQITFTKAYVSKVYGASGISFIILK